ncbi:hypothetical protein AHAS_Ahas07G0150200 [Arachis hypogaea]
MESFGLPCVHLVGVVVYLNMTANPRSLILEGWTKRTKQLHAHSDRVRVGEILDAAYMSMHAAMLDDCRELVSLSCRFFEDYVDVKTRLAKERQSLRNKHRQRLGVAEEASRVSVRDPLRARYKGCGRRVVTSRDKFHRVQRCRLTVLVGDYASCWIEYRWLLRVLLVEVTSEGMSEFELKMPITLKLCFVDGLGFPGTKTHNINRVMVARRPLPSGCSSPPLPAFLCFRGQKFIDFVASSFISSQNDIGHGNQFEGVEKGSLNTGYYLKSITIYPIKSCGGNTICRVSTLQRKIANLA